MAHDKHDKKIELSIQGMHCASCELTIERKFREIPGVKHAKVSQTNGKATVYWEREPKIEEFQDSIAEDGYHVTPFAEKPMEACSLVCSKNSKRDYLEIGAILLIIFGLYLFFKQTDLFKFNLAVSQNMSYGFIFLIGLVAASSTCIAVTGGVLISVAAKYNERFAAADATKFQKFKPHLWFNMGRIIFYTIFGGAIGALGSALSFSPKTTGVITLAASLFMILMGFRILNVFPRITRFSIPMPKFISHRILNLQDKQSKAIPFTVGALTFFLPCGFTQAFQLYAISRGSFVEGALIMLFFSLGTLPSLLSLGALSSFTKGSFYRLFLKFSGALVLILGFYNIGNGLALTGNPVNFASLLTVDKAFNSGAATVPIKNGKQIVNMDVYERGYRPSHFVIKEGIPVQWNVNGINTYGCQSILNLPKYGISKFIDKGPNRIEFTPQEAGELPFSCSMAMFRGSFTVLPRGAAAGVAAGNGATEPFSPSDISCNPDLMECNVQAISLEVSYERGFYPPVQTIKKNVPVELTVDTQVPLGGCMGIMTIPKYGVTKLLELGNNIIRFTPTEVGTVEAVCSMGALQTTFEVVE